MSDDPFDFSGPAFTEPPPEEAAPPTKKGSKFWRPNVGPVGLSVLQNRTSRTKFLYGPRGSLKTGVALHDVILHCYQDFASNARVFPTAVISTIVKGSATTGGPWEKLMRDYLPEWEEGIGLKWIQMPMDEQKNRYVFIANKAGKWSRIVLKSIPHGVHIRGRAKSMECSYFFFDELPEAEEKDYWLLPLQQLRLPTGGPRQYTATGNPSEDGEDHWTWKEMVVGAAKKQQDTDKPVVEIPPEGGRLKGLADSTAVYFLPLTENVYWTPEEKNDYIETSLMPECRGDPTAYDRLVKGLWVARPRGDGLFKNFFIAHLHIIGNPKEKTGILPLPDYPFIYGYDLGQVHNAIIFLQSIPLPDGTEWRVFDEIVHIGERLLYKKLAHEVIKRTEFWSRVMGGVKPSGIHITDESAVNQWRPGQGSYDALDFEKEYNRVVNGLQSGKTIKLQGCPKGDGSVEARVRLVQSLLATERFKVSARCKWVWQMLLQLEEDAKKPGHPRRSSVLHVFDGTTYPIFKFEMRLTGQARPDEIPTAASLLRAGSGSC